MTPRRRSGTLTEVSAVVAAHRLMSFILSFAVLLANSDIDAVALTFYLAIVSNSFS